MLAKAGKMIGFTRGGEERTWGVEGAGLYLKEGMEVNRGTGLPRFPRLSACFGQYPWVIQVGILAQSLAPSRERDSVRVCGTLTGWMYKSDILEFRGLCTQVLR